MLLNILIQQHLYKKGICVTHLGQQMRLLFSLAQSGEGRLIFVDVSMVADGDSHPSAARPRVGTPRPTFVTSLVLPFAIRLLSHSLLTLSHTSENALVDFSKYIVLMDFTEKVYFSFEVSM